MEIGWPDVIVARRPQQMRPALASVLLGCALVAVSGCAPSRPDTAHQPVARIGAALSLTGSGRFFGAAQRSGISLAQDEINASHLLGSTRLDVLVRDDGSD